MVNPSTENSSSWMESLVFDWTSYKPLGIGVQIRKDEPLFHEAQTASHVYTVISGRVRLCQMSPTGDEKTLLVVGANGLIGEIGLMEGTTYVTSAVGSTDSTLLALPLITFRQLFHHDSRFAEYVCQNLSKKAALLAQQATTLSYASAQYRIVNYLLELAHTFGAPHSAGVQIGIRFTHQEMANLVGTSRVTVAQVFSRLEVRKLVKKEGSFFYIPSTDALRQVLDQPRVAQFRSGQKY